MSNDSRPTVDIWHGSEDSFRLLVESVRDYGIFMLDPKGKIVSWNEGAARIKGYLATEIIGSHFSVFYPPEDILAGKPERELVEAAQEGRMEDEGWRVRKDGTRFWANVIITAVRDPQTGEVRGFGKVTRDLTERKRAEETLRHSEEQFRLLVESVEEYAIFGLDQEGRVMTWNSGARRAKGYTADEIIGQSFERFYTPEDRAEGKPRRMLQLARLHGRARDQGDRVRKDGTRFPADVLITAIHDHTGTLRGYSKVTRDLSEQLRTRKMEDAKLAAELASKAKDEFLAVLSHELRTPLTPVMAAIGYMLDRVGTLSREELVEHLQIARKNVLLEAQLVDDLLDLTRIARGKVELHFESVNAREALDDVIAICREEMASKNLTLSLSIIAQQTWVWADATRLRQIFWNLLTNAVKFTPAGGSIEVRMEDEGDRIRVEIADTGIGIADEHIMRIFGAFEQAERDVTRQFGGLGLGLAITRNLVQAHGGEISAHSGGKDKGARFKVTLARVPEPAAQSSEAPSANMEPTRQLRILLVDDHDDTRRVLQRLLSRKGHSVEAAASVAAAKERIGAEKFDVLISDIGLPDGTGHEVVLFAKQRDSTLYGIALSGFGMDADMERSIAAGFDLHLTKPVDPEILIQHLRAIAEVAMS